MRVLSIVSLAAAIFLAKNDAVSATTASDKAGLIIPAVAQSASSNQGDIARKRLLRDADEIDSDEERGIAISGFENLVKSGVQKAQVRMWLASKKSADTTFKLLQLEGKQGFLFASPGFLKWAKYVAKLDKENAGATMLETLLKRYDDAVLARMIQSAKGSANPNIEKLAKELQVAQFTKWMKANTRASDIGATLKGMENQRLWRSQDKELVKAYRYFIGAI